MDCQKDGRESAGKQTRLQTFPYIRSSRQSLAESWKRKKKLVGRTKLVRFEKITLD
jgi:hypothetical protein